MAHLIRRNLNRLNLRGVRHVVVVVVHVETLENLLRSEIKDQRSWRKNTGLS